MPRSRRAANAAPMLYEEQTVKPTRERRRHDKIIRDEVQDIDESGNPAWPHRVVDTLGIMLDKGTITAEQHAAAEDFRMLFRRAQLNALRCCDLANPRVDGAERPVLRPSAEYARRDVGDILGQIGSPGDSCLWHVVGLGMSLDEWRTERGWHGRAIDKAVARGILIAALGALVKPMQDLRGGKKAA
jgi:hypothetical protein